MNEARIEMLPAGTTGELCNFEPVAHVPAWSRFDERWYLGEYPAAPEQMRAAGLADLETFYRQYGARLGHSPNMFFDERYYLETNADVAALVIRGTIASGYSHYCAEGFHDRSPHWLFSEGFYLSSNPDVSRGLLDRHGLINGYDHYLSFGDGEFRSGHWLFDPMLYRYNKPEEDRSPATAGGSFPAVPDRQLHRRIVRTHLLVLRSGLVPADLPGCTLGDRRGHSSLRPAPLPDE